MNENYPASETYLIKKILEREVLSLGSFQLNSGINSRYYYNFSKFSDSKGLVELGFSFYEALKHYQIRFDVIVGSAYKGIVPALATSFYMFNNTELGKNVFWAFNRKEPKQHGESGNIVGTPLSRKTVLILDDVYTSGKALRKTIECVNQEGGSVGSILVAVNRSTEFIEHLDTIPIYFITSHVNILKQFR